MLIQGDMRNSQYVEKVNLANGMNGPHPKNLVRNPAKEKSVNGPSINWRLKKVTA